MKKTLLTLMAVLSCFAAKAQWSNDPAENNRINPDGETTYSEQVGSTSDGTTYIVYTRPKDGSIQTVLQILDKDGRKLFPDEGQLISNKRTLTFNMVSELLFVDKQGNAIIPVADCRNSPADKSYLNYTLYKVSPAGEKLWGDEGIDLGKGTPSASQCAMTVIQLEDDSYVAAWQNTDVSNKNTVKIERLSLSGEFLWEQALEVQETGVQMHWPTLTNAGNNLFNLVYYRGNAYEITVKKLDFDGEAVWAKDTKVYGEGFAPAAPAWNFVQIVPAPQGGIFIAWHDDRGGTETVYASYVKADGSLGFPGGVAGLRVNYAGYRSFEPKVAFDAERESLYITFREMITAQIKRYVTQKISLLGEILWEPDGVLVSEAVYPIEENFVSSQIDGKGNVAVFYMYAPNYGNVQARLHLLNGDGELLWEQPLIFSSSNNYKAGLTSTPLVDNKYWLAVWKDDKTPGNVDNASIFLQRINIDGSLGDNDTAIPVIHPSSLGNGEVSIYTILGQKISHLQRGINIVKQGTKTEKIIIK